MNLIGGYDEGYRNCGCFWGETPGSLITTLMQYIDDFKNIKVLDAGCGEGKNAKYLAQMGAQVVAIDVSSLALNNAFKQKNEFSNIIWEQADIRSFEIPKNCYDIIIAYGLLHCLKSAMEICDVVTKIQEGTKHNGYNIVCAFNSRANDMTAHPNFYPTFLPHMTYESLYEKWEILYTTDSDLHETHPHNNIPHFHSMTRIIARKR